MRRFLVQAQGEMWQEPRAQGEGSNAETGTPPRGIARDDGTVEATANTAFQSLSTPASIIASGS